MSGTNVARKPRHPANKNLSDAVSEGREQIKGRNGIDKTATLIKAPDAESGADGGLGATMQPTDEQLTRINQFTRKSVTKEDVVAFQTLSANDIVDRDDDQFTTQCVKDFAALPQPFSPTGKSFLVDHDYKIANAVGRIFGTDTKKISGSLFLTNEVYIPNTESNKTHIEGIDFGTNWAVSVGVMLGKDACSLCEAPFVYGWFCENGHDKGLFYVKDGEEDKWGYPIPVAPDSKGAVKAVRKFMEPRDMYELSQVILGAQYYAALDKLPDFAGVMKSVMDAGIPTIGLSTDEAKEIPFRHEPKRLSDARRNGLAKETDDGNMVWIEGDLVFSYDPEDPESGICSLGRKKETTNTEEENTNGEHTLSAGEGSDDQGEHDGLVPGVEEVGESGQGDHTAAPGAVEGGEPGSEGLLNAAADEDESEGDENDDSDSPDDDDSDDGDEADATEDSDEESDDSGDDADTSEDNEKEKAVTKKAVLAVARKAEVSESVLNAVKEASGTGLDVLVDGFSTEISTLRSEKAALETKATLGDKYLVAKRAEAVEWYVKGRQTSEGQSVKIETFERLLDRCGDDVDLIQSIIEQEQDLAKAKFPASVRRSSFPTDPNVPQGVTPLATEPVTPDEIQRDASARKVQRIHG